MLTWLNLYKLKTNLKICLYQINPRLLNKNKILLLLLVIVKNKL